MAVPPSKGKLLYHITHIDNMQSILNNGLLPRKELENRGFKQFVDIADPEILSKRESYKESLSKYVLFHFYPKNPFDCAVCNTYGSKNMVIITIGRDLSKNNKFLIIPSHPLDRNVPQIYPYEEGINQIRWDILDMPNGRDYSNPEIKKACMAECVMEYVIPARLFSYVYVQNEIAADKIRKMENSNIISVSMLPNMFTH